MSGVRPLVLQLSQKPRVAIEPPGASSLLMDDEQQKRLKGDAGISARNESCRSPTWFSCSKELAETRAMKGNNVMPNRVIVNLTGL